jgi:hypothetical protein
LTTLKKYRVPLSLAALCAWTAADLQAGGSHHRCVCGPDGSCPPNAYHFGYYQTQWRTWPTPTRPEDQRRPEAVTLPKVQTPGVTEEDLDVPPQPKGTPKGEPSPKTDDPLKAPPKTDVETKLPPSTGIEDILRPPTDLKPTETLPKSKPPTTPDAAKPDPAKPDPFRDEPKDKEMGDLLKGLEGTKKPAPVEPFPPLRPQPTPGDRPRPDDDKKMDDPLKDLPKFDSTKTSPTEDLSALDLSPRPRSKPASVPATKPQKPATAIVRISAIEEIPQRPSRSKVAALRELPVSKQNEVENPLRSGWSARRAPSPLRTIDEASGDSAGKESWSARKNPLRDK